MKLLLTFTDDDLSEEPNKTLCYTKNNYVYVSNSIDVKYINFIRKLFPKRKDIVYFEDERPECPNCDCKMNNNGSRRAKPNKLPGIRKEQYICPECDKTKVTSLKEFIPENSNFSYDMRERCLNYEYISYLSYEKKAEMIKFENKVKMSRQTAYHFESIYDERFLKRQEHKLAELLKEKGIKPSGIYHYDEQFPHQNGKALVRLTLIDAITNLPINELIIDKKDFDKSIVKSFLESSLSALPREALITDGDPMYPEIIEKIGIKHQLCIFHIIKNHHDKTFKSIRKISKGIISINNKIENNKETITELENIIEDDDYSKKKKSKTRKRINKLKDENKKLRKQRREKKDALKEILNTNESIENIYNAEDKKGATRRYNTINNRKKHLDKNTENFLDNLDKKLDNTLTYYDNPLIPRTNNNVERYFGITLPGYLKRKYRTVKGLTRWLRLQRIRWIRRNVLHNYELENIPITEELITI